MPFAFKGWEVGTVFPSLNLMFGFFGRSSFLVACVGAPLLTLAFAVSYFEKTDWFICLKEKKVGEHIVYYTWLS